MTREERVMIAKTEIGNRKKATLASRDLLKEYIKEIGKQKRCPICGEDDPRTFQKHHINGDHDDNAKKNIVKICANCHNLTYTAKDQLRELWEQRHKKFSNLRKGADKAWKTRRYKEI